MSKTSKFKSFVQSISWSRTLFFGISLFIGIWGLYATLHEKKPGLLFEIISDVNVIDINTPLDELTILFKDKDIEKNNQNLRIYTLRIENIGEIDILQNQYDINDLWGFRVNNATIIELRLESSNSNYVKQKLNPTLIDSNVVEFSKIIFEKGIFFSLEVLILHHKDKTPDFTHLGKIAALDEVLVTKRTEIKDDRSLIDKATEVLLKGLKIFGTIFGFIVSLVLIGMGIEWIREFRTRKRREKRGDQVESLLGEIDKAKNNSEKVARQLYVKYGIKRLEQLKDTVNNDENLINLYYLLEMNEEIETTHEKYNKIIDTDFRRSVLSREYPLAERSRYPIISRMYDEKLIKLKDDKIEIDSDFKKNINHIIELFKT